MKHLFAFILSAASLPLSAQTSFTGHLRAAQDGKGVVVVIQSDEIEQAVNGKKEKAVVTKKTNPSSKATTPSKATHDASSASRAAHSATKPQHEAEQSKKQHGETESGSHASDASASNGSVKHYTDRARRKAQGYRICIYTGGNSRADREKAVQMGNNCRAKFSELASYPTFVAPRWVTYVGDFRSREEAQKYVTRIRKAHISYEVRIVKSEVNLPY